MNQARKQIMVEGEEIQREMPMQLANTIEIPRFSAPSKMMSNLKLPVKDHLNSVDAFPFSRNPEEIVAGVKASSVVKSKMNIDLGSYSEMRLRIEAEVRNEIAEKDAFEKEMSLIRGISTIKKPRILAPSTIITNHMLPVSDHMEGRLAVSLPFNQSPDETVTAFKISDEVETNIINDLVSNLKMRLEIEAEIRKGMAEKDDLEREVAIMGCSSTLIIKSPENDSKKLDEEQNNDVVVQPVSNKYEGKVAQLVTQGRGDVIVYNMLPEKVDEKGASYFFWCSACEFGTLSMEGMEAHLKRNKHVSIV